MDKYVFNRNIIDENKKNIFFIKTYVKSAKKYREYNETLYYILNG